MTVASKATKIIHRSDAATTRRVSGQPVKHIGNTIVKSRIVHQLATDETTTRRGTVPIVPKPPRRRRPR